MLGLFHLVLFFLQWNIFQDDFSFLTIKKYYYVFTEE